MELGTHSLGRFNGLKRLNTHAEKTSKFSLERGMSVREGRVLQHGKKKKKEKTT